MTNRSDVTVGLVGAATAVAATLAPKIWDKIAGGRKEAQDGAAVLAGGASEVTAAALALLERMQQDRDDCRAELARVNARIDEMHVMHGLNVGRPAPPSG